MVQYSLKFRNRSVKKLSGQKGKEASLAFGGQALIEGVMMRSRKNMVLCVRKPSKEIVTSVEQLNPLADRYKVLGLPFLRGIVMLFESFYLGFKGLMFSANVALEDDEEDNKSESTALSYMHLAIIIACVAGITAVFFLGPFFLTTWFKLSDLAFNIVEALIRLGMFVAYLTIIASWSEFRRVLRYHGAEHKAINAYEAGVPMDVEHVKKHSRLHPRCGTSFLFIVLAISIVLFTIMSTLMPNSGFAWRIAYRILLIPVIAAISYELLRLSGKYRNNIISRILTVPGMGFQLLTTKEPTDDMLEVSIAAVKKVTELTTAPNT
ncbi:MAG: DUF1385 domain-containing protein [Candidatus Bathyarchaeota archaeon]|nr:DUF1385 domain-containing protein [Candidatus Bathyarchaeota archaeon]